MLDVDLSNLKQLRTVGNLAAKSPPGATVRGQCIPMRKHFCREQHCGYTAVQCMQECSTFTINFKTFATALGTHTIHCNQPGYGATVQVTSDCSKRWNVLEKAFF
eukprot:s4958_g4.t1